MKTKMNKDNVAEKWEDKIIRARGYNIPEKEPFIVFDKENEIWNSKELVKYIKALLTSHRLSLKEELMKKLPRKMELPKDIGLLSRHERENLAEDIGFNICLSQVKEIITSVFNID